MEERQILAALDSRWITNLFASFQDEVSLYLVMDYLPGGDLSNLIMRADEGTLILNEPFVKFYIAETLMALGDLHKLNFVHRYSHSILHLLNNLEDN
jgi:serine/threonine kinase 38